MPFNGRHLEAFKQSLNQEFAPWVGLSPMQWARDVGVAPDQPETLPDRPVSRQALFEMSSNNEISDLDLAISVLAWGGMNRNHGRSLFKDCRKWLPTLTRLRNKDINSLKAYAEFRQLRQSGDLPGMGPAYFTKLIFFAAPSHDGFIMDQWTARSANLLTGKKMIHTIMTMNRTGRVQHIVSDRNDEESYEQFCGFISELADRLGYNGREAKIEEALFSTGRGIGSWRNYVISNG